MPPWIRKLFNEHKLVFELDANGTIALSCVEDITPTTQKQIAKKIFGYMDSHPCTAFKALEVQ